MGYDLVVRRQRTTDARDGKLHLSVWEMSRIRDRMLNSGAAFCADPPREALHLHRRHPGSTRGIPAYKLAMIDGFLVRPDEIREALEILRASDSRWDDDELWKAWLVYLNLAAQGGGFTVE